MIVLLEATWYQLSTGVENSSVPNSMSHVFTNIGRSKFLMETMEQV